MSSPLNARSSARRDASQTVLSEAGESEAEERRHRGKAATVFDAVAGRVTSTNALEDSALFSHAQKTNKRPRPLTQKHSARGGRDVLRNATLAPEEALFRSSNAPVRYSERDIYFANEHLPGGGSAVLPDSDMLKALHVYCSHFYARTRPNSDIHSSHQSRHDDSLVTIERQRSLVDSAAASVDEHSMDETALLAFGIILEEASRELLGSNGDLVFTEGEEPSEAEY